MKAVPSRAVMAATADAVSCDADATTGVPASDACGETRGSSGPTIIPLAIGGAMWGGESSRVISAVAQVRVLASTSWVVVAFVNSETARPVSHRLKRSAS